MTEETKKKPWGLSFASPELRQKVAANGGKTISKDRAHMAALGRKGGKAVSSKPGFMSMIGRGLKPTEQEFVPVKPRDRKKKVAAVKEGE